MDFANGIGDPLLTPLPDRICPHPHIDTFLAGIRLADTGEYLWKAAPEGYRYEPLVREGVEWKYVWTQSDAGTGEFYLRFDGTEEIEGKTYNVCYRYGTPDFKKEEARIAGYFREDGHKVYAIPTMARKDKHGTADKKSSLTTSTPGTATSSWSSRLPK